MKRESTTIERIKDLQLAIRFNGTQYQNRYVLKPIKRASLRRSTEKQAEKGAIKDFREDFSDESNITGVDIRGVARR